MPSQEEREGVRGGQPVYDVSELRQQVESLEEERRRLLDALTVPGRDPRDCCEDCAYWNPTTLAPKAGESGEQQGECRHGPPQNDMIRPLWPTTGAKTGWCGGFRRKRNGGDA